MKHNPHEAAIKALKIEMETDAFYNQTEELLAAIRLLGVAGKVGDPKFNRPALEALKDAAFFCRDYRQQEFIQTLIEAIPDKED